MEVFVGSSRESLDLVREIEVWLEAQNHKPLPWDTPGLFLPGDHTFNTLISISRRVEGAVFVLSEDDEVWYRGDSAGQPRDNVLIEYGLFAGALGPRKAIICRSGRPKQADDLKGITYIDLSEPRRARGKLEVSIWARKLDSRPQDPELIRLQAKIAELEQERLRLADQLAFETDKSTELGQILTDREIVDFTKYHLDADGHWKLLFDYDYFEQVAEILSKSVDSPVELREILAQAGMNDVIDKIAWHSRGDPEKLKDELNPQSRYVFARKILRVFRFYTGAELYPTFVRKLPKAIRVQFEETGTSAATRLSRDLERRATEK